ncbi:hypothetical protein SAY87_022813 [Trapa incisa]|uniref:Uncharacterized protein n=1 Tax=Trapa incisa TaxID=236973 RepID=A0AAN7K8T2_9MYRT|nr:hypothetical protein SAY87_022813 [Trapa incisa]
MASLNFTSIPDVVVNESKGDSNEPDATVDNANTYNGNLIRIRHILNKTGTPKHPGIAVSTYIYELYLYLDANGIPVYILRLIGSEGWY